MSIDIANSVITKIEKWAGEGKEIEFWTPGSTGRYLCQLINEEINPYQSWDWLVHNKLEMLKALAGPHGWAYHQIMVARYKERIKMEDKTFDTKP